MGKKATSAKAADRVTSLQNAALAPGPKQRAMCIMLLDVERKVFGRISGELDMPNEEVHFCRPPLSLQTSNSNVNM